MVRTLPRLVPKKFRSDHAGQLLEGGLVLVLLLLAGDRQPDDDFAGMATGAGAGAVGTVSVVVVAGVAASSRAARQISVGVRTGRVHAAGLQFGEDLGEEARLGVDSQHVRRQPVHDEQASVPELVLGVLHQERLQRVANLVAHVRVGQIETGQDRRLEFRFLRLLAVDQLPD